MSSTNKFMFAIFLLTVAGLSTMYHSAKMSSEEVAATHVGDIARLSALGFTQIQFVRGSNEFQARRREQLVHGVLNKDALQVSDGPVPAAAQRYGIFGGGLISSL